MPMLLGFSHGTKIKEVKCVEGGWCGQKMSNCLSQTHFSKPWAAILRRRNCQSRLTLSPRRTPLYLWWAHIHPGSWGRRSFQRRDLLVCNSCLRPSPPSQSYTKGKLGKLTSFVSHFPQWPSGGQTMGPLWNALVPPNWKGRPEFPEFIWRRDNENFNELWRAQ